MAETATVDSLDIQITATANKAIAALETLSKRLEKVSASLRETQAALEGQTKAQEEANKAAEENAEETDSVVRETEKMTASTHKAVGALAKLAKAFGRIMLYRAIRTIIKNIGSAIREGLTNLKEYSEAVGTAFAPAVDNLRQHVLRLKNAFATALRPVIEALIPVIIRLVDWLSKLFDFIAQVMSVLTGKVDDKGRYTKAILSDIEKSNKKAKELRRTLLGFDEINRLDGGTGSGESSGSGLMFTQAEISPEAVKTAEKIQKIWAKIKEIIDAIDWDLVLKVLAGLYALKILSKIVGWLQPIIALFSGAGGIIALVLAVITVFGLWGDKIHDFIEKTAIPKTQKFFDKIKEAIPVLEPLISTIEEIVLAVEEVVATVAQVIYDLVHGDIDKAWEDLIMGAKNTWQHIKKAVLHIIDGLKEELEKKWDEVKLGILLMAQAVLSIINEYLDQVPFIDLHIDTTELDETIKELKKTVLPDLNEKVKVKGTYSQSPFKINLDTKDAEKKANTLADIIRGIMTGTAGILPWINSSHGSGKGFASGGYPTMGSYFYAGEHGAEWVGDINGRTGVMNTDQMADAMYSAMSAALANNPQGGGDIYLDGEVIYRNTVRRNNNQVRSTGRAALLT